MPTYHRSQRLRLVGTGPKVEQLQEGRFRLTFTCTATNPNEAWMNGNKDQIMTAYGTLQSAQKNIAGIDPRTDEAYSDMVLFRTEANPSERDLIITLVYETATETFVKSQDDRIDFELNGLQRVTRVTIAKTGTTLPSVTVGVTSIGVNSISCKLASRSVEENDAFIQITETYLQSGITDVREDIIGSQKAIVITKVGNEPTRFEASEKSDITYDGGNDWSIARKDVSQEGGLKIYNYTFLLDNTVLSQSQDKQGSLKTEVIEVFNPKVTIDGLTVEGGSTVAGNYFLSVVQSNGRNQYFQSQGDVYPKTISYNGTSWRLTQYSGVYATSTDTNPDNPEDPPSTGWSGTGDNEVTQITIREFDQTLPNSTSGFELSHRYDKEGYSLINIQRSNLDGIPTMRYTFAKDNVLISQSEEKVGSQLAIVKEVFNGTPSEPSGYVLASEEESNVDGIPTRRYRFLKEDVQLSLSVDNQSPLKTEVQEWFNPEGDNDRDSKAGYSLINQQDSNVQGIPTVRYTFAKNNVLLSVSEDKIGSQNAIVNEIFKPANEASIPCKDVDGNTLNTHTEADRTESNHDGIKTVRVRFLKPSIISVAQDFVGDINTIQVTAFNKTESEVKNDLDEVTNDHKLISQRENDHDGIKTTTYTFEINTSDIIQFTADDRLQVTRTIYEAHDYNYDSNYTVGTSTATVNGTLVTLTSLRVDQRGTTGSFTKLTAVYTQPKIVTVSPIMTSQYNDVPVYQYKSIVSSANTINTSATISDPNGTNIQTNAVFFEPSINNNTSPSTFTQNVLNTSTDLSVANSSVLINSHDDLYNFLYPGVVRLNSRFFGRTSAGRYARIDIKTIKESYPTTTKVRCNVYNFIQRNGDIEDTDFTYDGASGLWSANSWATVDANITRGYFSLNPEPNFTSNVYTGYRMNGSSIRGTLQRISLIAGTYNTNVFYNGVNYGTEYNGYFYEVKITEPGPPDPVGRKWCLGVDIKPVFRDTSGNTYYNKQIIVTERIPIKQRGQVTYN